MCANRLEPSKGLATLAGLATGKVEFEDYKRAYNRFWDGKKRTTPADIELMIDLINERTVHEKNHGKIP